MHVPAPMLIAIRCSAQILRTPSRRGFRCKEQSPAAALCTSAPSAPSEQCASPCFAFCKCGVAQGRTACPRLRSTCFVANLAYCVAVSLTGSHVRTEYQAHGSPLSCAVIPTLCNAQIATKEGLPGFYRGFGAMLVGLVPASAAYFGG